MPFLYVHAPPFLAFLLISGKFEFQFLPWSKAVTDNTLGWHASQPVKLIIMREEKCPWCICMCTCITMVIMHVIRKYYISIQEKTKFKCSRNEANSENRLCMNNIKRTHFSRILMLISCQMSKYLHRANVLNKRLFWWENFILVVLIYPQNMGIPSYLLPQPSNISTRTDMP